MVGTYGRVRSLHLFVLFFFSLFNESLFRSILAVFFFHAANYAFAKIPIGVHTMLACIAMSAIVVFLSSLLRSFSGSIVPFEALIMGFPTLILGDILYGMIKFIPVKDERTGLTKRYGIGT